MLALRDVILISMDLLMLLLEVRVVEGVVRQAGVHGIAH